MLHTLERFLYFLRQPYVVLVAEKDIIGIHNEEHFHEIAHSSLVVAFGKNNDVVVAIGVLQDDVGRIVGGTVVADVEGPVGVGLGIEGVYLCLQIGLAVVGGKQDGHGLGCLGAMALRLRRLLAHFFHIPFAVPWESL